MALVATASSSTTFKPVPQGVFAGRCSRVIDLGTQETEFQGKKRHVRKVMIAWELQGEDDDGNPLERDDGEGPLAIAKRYTLSLSEKASLRADLEAWRGRAFTEEELAGFDLQQLLNAPCLINVKHAENNGRTYANVAGLSPVPKAMRATLKPLHAKAQFFEVTDPDMELFATFSDGLQTTIRACAEWQAPKTANEQAKESASGMAGLDDDIPF